MKVKVCPKCGKHNLENAWSCTDCGQTLSMKTLIDTEDGQPSVVPIAGQPALSNVSLHFEQDVVEILDAIIQGDESVIWGCNITQSARIPPFKFGYLIITSQRLICVRFKSELKREAASSALSLLLSPLTFLMKEAVRLNVRPKRPLLSPAVPAVNYPSYPLTPDEKASRRVAIHDLENLVSADLASSWYGEIRLVSLTVRFRQGKEMIVTFYTPHEAMEAHKLLAARLGK
jgi:hypothetical protein